jgi:hypothetical protein
VEHHRHRGGARVDRRGRAHHPRGAAAGCAVSKKVDGVHVLDRGPFDPNAEEYQVIAPIAGG